jgi:hypothetical protein
MRNFAVSAWNLLHDESFRCHLDHAIRERKYLAFWDEPSEPLTPRSWGSCSGSLMSLEAELQGLSTEKNPHTLRDIVYKRYRLETYSAQYRENAARVTAEATGIIEPIEIEATGIVEPTEFGHQTEILPEISTADVEAIQIPSPDENPVPTMPDEPEYGQTVMIDSSDRVMTNRSDTLIAENSDIVMAESSDMLVAENSDTLVSENPGFPHEPMADNLGFPHKHSQATFSVYTDDVGVEEPHGQVEPSVVTTMGDSTGVPHKLSQATLRLYMDAVCVEDPRDVVDSSPDAVMENSSGVPHKSSQATLHLFVDEAGVNGPHDAADPSSTTALENAGPNAVTTSLVLAPRPARRIADASPVAEPNVPYAGFAAHTEHSVPSLGERFHSFMHNHSDPHGHGKRFPSLGGLKLRSPHKPSFLEKLHFPHLGHGEHHDGTRKYKHHGRHRHSWKLKEKLGSIFHFHD